MKSVKKIVSILLSLIMILSIFTIIPATSASAESVQIFARKWVEGYEEVGGYFSFDDLYSEFIICRCSPDFDETNFNLDDTTNVYNRTGNISLGGYNEIRLKGWNDGNNHLDFYVSTNAGVQGNGKIYLSTKGDGIDLNTDGVKWYAYTWETFTAESVAASSPSYDAEEYFSYKHGVEAHYLSGDRLFTAIEGATDGHQNVSQVTYDQIIVPYFEFSKVGSGDDAVISLVKCNGIDADIIVPETVPANYTDNDFIGKSFTDVAGGAFSNMTDLNSVTFGNNIVRFRADDLDGNDVLTGAFDSCTNLKSVTAGSNFAQAQSGCFNACPALTDFTTTSTQSENLVLSGFEGIAQQNEELALHCPHDSAFTREFFALKRGLEALENPDYDYTISFIDDPAVPHSYTDTWNWGYDGVNEPVVSFNLECPLCGFKYSVENVALQQVVINEPNCTDTGLGYYKAVVEYDGQTFESTGSDDPAEHPYTYVILANGHTPSADEYYTDLYEYNNDASAPKLRKVYWCTECLKYYSEGDWFDVAHYPYINNCNGDDRYEYCKDQNDNIYIFVSNEDTYLFRQTTDSSFIVPANGHSMDHVARVTPTYDAETNEYTNGNIEYWHCAACDKYFSDADGEHEIAQSETVLPYFRFSFNDQDMEIGLYGYNGADTVVTIPDTIPGNYPDETLRGKRIEYIHFTAFNNNTFITKVVMGDHVKHIGWRAFRGCKALKEIEIGSGLRKIDSSSFFEVNALEKFTCTATLGTISVVRAAFDQTYNVTFYGYHNSSFQAVVNNGNFSYYDTPRKFIGLDEHIYSASWSWENDLSSATATLTGCANCSVEIESVTLNNAVITSAVTKEPQIGVEGVRTYTATVTYNDKTYTTTRDEAIEQLYAVEYIDENDETKTAGGYPITADTTELAAGWYYVDGNVTVDNTINITGDVKIVLKDGSKLTVNGELGRYIGLTNYPITLYRQSGETQGELKATSITSSDFTLVGSKITADTFIRTYGDLTVCGGELIAAAPENLNAVVCDGDINISGGSVYSTGATCLMTLNGTVTISGGDTELRGFGSGILAKNIVITGGTLIASASDVEHDGKGIKSNSNVTIGWTDADHDSVTSSGFDHSVVLTKPFRDQNGTLYLPETYGVEELASKQLVPAVPHEHTPAHVEAVAASCTESGNIEYWYCADCEKYFSDSYGCTEIAQADTVVAPHGHDYGDGPAVVWDADHRYATATFTCIHGDDEQTVRSPKAAITDVTAYPTSTANGSCRFIAVIQFNGASYEAQTVAELPYFYYDKEGDEVRVIDYKGNDTDITIPDTVPDYYPNEELRGLPITAVNDYGMQYQGTITSVTMGDNIERIGYHAFFNCLSLVSVTVGSGLHAIYYESFGRCENLISFTCTSKENFPQDTFGSPFVNSRKVTAFVCHNTSLLERLSSLVTCIGLDRHSEPAWTWSDDNRSATAKFNCGNNCHYTSGDLAAAVTSEITTIPTAYTEGVRTYTASVIVEGERYTDTRTETIPVCTYFSKHSLTLTGEIGVNFYLDVNVYDVADGKVTIDFSCNGKDYSETVEGPAIQVDGKLLFKATCYVSAAEMMDDITATLYIDGVKADEDHYTVREYADVILAGDYDQNTKDVVNTMLNYGAMAQKQFGHNTDNLANAGISYNLVDLTLAEVEALGGELPKKSDNVTELSAYGVKYYGCSLLLRSETTLRFYFEKTDESRFDPNDFKINGLTVAVHDYAEGSRYVYIEVADIAAPDLDRTYNISVGNVAVGTVSPLSYAKDVLTDEGASENLKNVMTALYRYYEAADRLFPNE